MMTPALRSLGPVVAALLATGGASAADRPDAVQVTPQVGEMSSEMVAATPDRPRDTLRFEPWQMIDEMFARDDVVWIMRHGPTDWTMRDIKDVAPDDCANQRLLSAQGRTDMENLGVLLAENGVMPGRIVVSEWCRNQATLEALLEGAARVDPAFVAAIDVETSPALNLLLSLQGAPSVRELRDIAMAWDGDAPGPLLLLTHFTNIEELLDFRVYEGEILIADPDRDLRVLGYLRLRGAAPDAVHFATE